MRAIRSPDLASSTSRIGHGFAFSETVTDTESYKSSSLAEAVNIKVFTKGLDLTITCLKNVPDAEMQHKFTFRNFLSYTHVSKGNTGDITLKILVGGLMVSDEFNFKISRQFEFTR